MSADDLAPYFSICLGVSLRVALTEKPLPEAVLSKLETDRFKALTAPRRRASYLLGRAAVHSLVEDHSLAFPALGYSLSHSVSATSSLAIAVEATQDAQLLAVGVDIERISPRKLGLARRFLNDREFALFESLPESERETIRFWTIKEAVWKAAQASAASVALVTQAEILSLEGAQGLACFEGREYRFASCLYGYCFVTVAIEG